MRIQCKIVVIVVFIEGDTDIIALLFVDWTPLDILLEDLRELQVLDSHVIVEPLFQRSNIKVVGLVALLHVVLLVKQCS